jgi:hypothetical protein
MAADSTAALDVRRNLEYSKIRIVRVMHQYNG